MAVVEEGFFGSEDLVVFVAFSSDEDDVSVSSNLDGVLDRFSAIDDGEGIVTYEASLGFLDNKEGVFGPRVVGGDDTNITEFTSRACHERALAAVSVSATSKDGNQAAWL